MQQTSVFNAQSQQTRDILHLFIFDLSAATVVLALVTVLVFWFSFRFRRKRSDREPRQRYGTVSLELTWTILPLMLMSGLFAWSWITMKKVLPHPEPYKPRVVVYGHQWFWELYYPGFGFITANELHLPVGEDSLLLITGFDVIHSFWVPALAYKEDGIPNKMNPLWITPTRTGVYLGTCSEYCGPGHGPMKIRVFVEPKDKYFQWVLQQASVPPKPTSGLPLTGYVMFMSRTCAGCHSIAGTEATGDVGPDLTHVADRTTLGAGALKNSPKNLALWIKDPQKYKPDCHMPEMQLTIEEAREYAAYLDSLK